MTDPPPSAPELSAERLSDLQRWFEFAHVPRHVRVTTLALIEQARRPTPDASASETGGEPEAAGLRQKLDWRTGLFRVFDPDPSDAHGALFLVCPCGLSLNVSAHAMPGVDEARAEWMVHVLNTALTRPVPAPDTGKLREAIQPHLERWRSEAITRNSVGARMAFQNVIKTLDAVLHPTGADRGQGDA